MLPALALVAELPGPAAAQTNQYEMRYGGQVVEVSVDNLLQMPEQYAGKAVRTRGQLEMVPGSTELRYALRGTFGGYLQLVPVPEAQMEFERLARVWAGREVEVTGGVESGQDTNGQKVVYLLIWAYLGPPDEKAARFCFIEAARVAKETGGRFVWYGNSVDQDLPVWPFLDL